MSNHILNDAGGNVEHGSQDLRENNLNNFATRFGSDLDGTIEENPMHSLPMVRLFSIEARSKMARRLSAKCSSYFHASP